MVPRNWKYLCLAVSLPGRGSWGNPSPCPRASIDSLNSHLDLHQAFDALQRPGKSDTRLALPLSCVNSPILFQDFVAQLQCSRAGLFWIQPLPCPRWLEAHVQCNLGPRGAHFHSAGHATWPHGFRGGIWILLRKANPLSLRGHGRLRSTRPCPDSLQPLEPPGAQIWFRP